MRAEGRKGADSCIRSSAPRAVCGRRVREGRPGHESEEKERHVGGKSSRQDKNEGALDKAKGS